MRNYVTTIGIGFLLAAGVFAQTPVKKFEAASVKPSTLDMQKLIQAAQSDPSSIASKIGMHVNPGRVEFTYVDLKTLVSIAYKMKVYQVSGPDWISSQRYDIMATFPQGATRDDIPQMLQALLKDRFKLEAHVESKEHPVLALVVAKGGPKLVESKESPTAIDETVPLKEGEMQTDTPDGPVRMTMDMKNGGATVDMGNKGKMTYSIDRPAAGTTPDLNSLAFRIQAKQITMPGFVEMLSQFTSQIGGGAGKQIVDMTGLTGHYEVSIAIPFSDLLAIAKSAGIDIPNLPATGGNTPAGMTASDPTGGGTMLNSVQALGLRLENRKAVVDQVVVDRAEKVPTEN